MDTSNDNSKQNKKANEDSSKPSDKDFMTSPERLQDNDHRMDKRINDVQDSVTYDQNIRKDTTETDDDLERRWSSIKSDYKRHYESLTDEDLEYKSGNFNAVVERIAKRTNRNPSEVHDEIENWKLEKDR